jgi:predicted transposase YdaD
LRFVAEAEHVPSQLLETILEEEFIMASDFYQSVINKGIVKGREQGEARGAKKEITSTIVRLLRRRLGSVNDDVQERMMAETSLDTLREWLDMATDAADAESAQRLVDTIRKTQAA